VVIAEWRQQLLRRVYGVPFSTDLDFYKDATSVPTVANTGANFVDLNAQK
jgi:hypothetical protein